MSINTLSAPDSAHKFYERAKKALLKKNPQLEKATRDLEKAVDIYPEFAAAWNLLGETRVKQNNLEGARQALTRAVEADPVFITPYLTLTLMQLEQNRMAEAVRLTERVVALAPELAEAHYYRAVGHSALGNLDEAEASIRVVQASEEAYRYPRTHFMLGNVLAERGDIPAAATAFQQYLEREPTSRAADAVRQQLAQWKADGRIE